MCNMSAAPEKVLEGFHCKHNKNFNVCFVSDYSSEIFQALQMITYVQLHTFTGVVVVLSECQGHSSIRKL